MRCMPRGAHLSHGVSLHRCPRGAENLLVLWIFGAYARVEFLLAVVAVVGLFWSAVIFWRGGLVGGMLCVLLAGICFGHPFFNLPAGPVPLTADRLLLVVLTVQYAVFHRFGWVDPKPLGRADYLLAAFLAVLAFSTVTHDFRYRNAAPLAQLIFFYAMPAVMYWIARQTAWTRPSALGLFLSLSLFGIYLAATAVAETHQMPSIVFPRYIASPAFREFFGRSRGPLLNPAGNGILLGLCLGATLMWWPRLNRLGQVSLLGVIVLLAWGVYCTLTRSAWMGAGLALLLVVACATPRGWRSAVIATALLASVLVLAVSWQHIMSFKRDKDLSAEDMAESAKLRPILATVAWHMFLDRPLLGCGYGQYIQESPPYLSDRTTDLPLEKARPYVQHNVFLALLAETGLIGMGLFIAVLVTWTHAAWRLWRTETDPLWMRQMGLLFLAMLGAYLPNGMFHDVSIIPMINTVLFFLGGSVVGLYAGQTLPPRSASLRVWMPGEQPVAVC